MCGITGAVWYEPRLAVTQEKLVRMTQVLTHRGPDSDGYYTSDLRFDVSTGSIPGVVLGHRRLAVIDLESSRQPMANEDGSVQVLFNGEIYNFRELRHRLEANGHHFRSCGDTEVLVHLYEDEGVDFVRHLVGMFAIAVWDSHRRRVVLARDRIGQKPLVFHSEPGRLMFASELKSLLAADIPCELDPRALDEYLMYQYIPAPQTIVRGIQKLPPGHLAIYENDRLHIERYWQPDFGHEEQLEETECVERVSKLLSEAVRSQLVSDVPLGVFLSGGVDSSIVAAIARAHVAGPLRTFSVGFADPTYDEAAFARRVAQHLGIEHVELRIESQAEELIDQIVCIFDEPFGDSSALPTLCLANATREHVTVALSGDGGDELFAGYDRYRAMRLAARFERLPRRLRASLARTLGQLLPARGRQRHWANRFRRLARIVATSPDRRYAETISIFTEEARAALYSTAFLGHLSDSDPSEHLSDAIALSEGRDLATSVSLADFITYLPGDICHKIDIATMAHGLECRQPMLDHRLVEFAIAMPAKFKLHSGRGKWILHRAFAGLLPREVFQRSKRGFGVPLDEWIRGPLREMLRDTLISTTAKSRGYFDVDEVERLLTEHESRRHDHSHRLWLLLMLELWHRRWLDGPR